MLDEEHVLHSDRVEATYRDSCVVRCSAGLSPPEQQVAFPSAQLVLQENSRALDDGCVELELYVLVSLGNGELL